MSFLTNLTGQTASFLASYQSTGGTVNAGSPAATLAGAGASGVVSGVMTGAALGSAVPGVGTVVGGIVGGVVSAIGGALGSGQPQRPFPSDVAQIQLYIDDYIKANYGYNPSLDDSQKQQIYDRCKNNSGINMEGTSAAMFTYAPYKGSAVVDTSGTSSAKKSKVTWWNPFTWFGSDEEPKTVVQNDTNAVKWLVGAILFFVVLVFIALRYFPRKGGKRG